MAAARVLYVLDVPGAQPTATVKAWDPHLAGVAEVFHARYPDHRYPMHTHDRWTLLIVDAGVITYDLHRHDHGAFRTSVTLLPPFIAHDGRPVGADGFTKRVLYLEPDVVGLDAVGRTVDHPTFADPDLREQISRLDHALEDGERLEAESRLALAIDRIRRHLGVAEAVGPRVESTARVASEARDIIDADPTAPVALTDIAAAVGASPAHVVRSFTRAFGLPPHRYVISRRIERARTLLLAGESIATAAALSGFHDQSHLHRHFTRMLSVTPATFRTPA